MNTIRAAAHPPLRRWKIKRTGGGCKDRKQKSKIEDRRRRKIVDMEGNIITKIAEGNYTSCDFSADGEYFSYSLDGNIWIDKLIK